MSPTPRQRELLFIYVAVSIRLQKQLRIYHDWVESLNAQNGDLIRTVEEIEAEACKRLDMLEQQLTGGTNTTLADPASSEARIRRLQSDVTNLLEFLRRARDEGSWNAKGLIFYGLRCEDILGKDKCNEEG